MTDARAAFVESMAESLLVFNDIAAIQDQLEQITMSRLLPALQKVNDAALVADLSREETEQALLESCDAAGLHPDSAVVRTVRDEVANLRLEGQRRNAGLN